MNQGKELLSPTRKGQGAAALYEEDLFLNVSGSLLADAVSSLWWPTAEAIVKHKLGQIKLRLLVRNWSMLVLRRRFMHRLCDWCVAQDNVAFIPSPGACLSRLYSISVSFWSSSSSL